MNWRTNESLIREGWALAFLASYLFNRSTLDDVGLLGEGKQGTKLPSEMNSLVDDHEEFVKSSA